MRISWRHYLVMGALALLVAGCRGNPPTPTITPKPPTNTPRPPTATPEPVVTEVRVGIYFTDITVTQPDIPSGQPVGLPMVAADAAQLYTYDGNLISFNVSIGSDSDISFPLRIEVSESSSGEVLASADVPASNTSQNSATITWDTSDKAWSADGAAVGERAVAVRLLDESGEALATQTYALTVRPRPVILVHGWNATAGMWSDYPGYLTDAATGWLGLPADNLSTGAPGHPFHDAEWNADKLNEFINAQRAQLDAQHVDMVGHSMGGLIGRAYLQAYGAQDVDGQPVVLRLLTLGTPNQGSPCGNIGAVLSVFSSKLDGAWHFTPAYMAEFNRTVTETHSTTLHALAGTNVWTCGVPGDGVVPVGSATAYGINNRIAEFTAHIPGVELWELVFGARDFEYSQTQFNDFVLPNLKAAPSVDAPPAFTMQAAALTESDAPPVTQQYALTVPSGSIAVMTINALGGDDLGVMFAPVAGITAELRAPDGTTIASLSADDMETSPLSVLPFEDAPAGTYTVHFTNTGTETATVDMAVFESGLGRDLVVTAVPQPDGKVLLTAVVMSGGAPMDNADITAHLDLTDSDAAVQVHGLLDGGEAVGGTENDGMYTALLDLPPGVYSVAFKAQMSAYTLTEMVTVEVAAPSGD